MLLLTQLARAEAASSLARLVEPWNSLYSDSKAVATAVMFFTSSMLLRMPIAFASSSLFATSTWGTLAVLLGIAVLGFRLATRPGAAQAAFR